MITEKQIEKSIIKFFDVDNTIKEWGKIKKHSNVCWEYFKYDEALRKYHFFSQPFFYMVEQGLITAKNLPFRKHIMNYNFKRLIICENKNTGISILKRNGVDEISIDIEKITINNKEFYIVY